MLAALKAFHHVPALPDAGFGIEAEPPQLPFRSYRQVEADIVEILVTVEIGVTAQAADERQVAGQAERVARLMLESGASASSS